MGTIIIDKLTINAPSPKVLLIEIACTQLSSAKARIIPPPTACDNNWSVNWRTCLKQSGNKQSEATKKRSPTKPKGGNPWIVSLEKIHPSPASAVVATSIQAALFSAFKVESLYCNYFIIYEPIVSDSSTNSYDLSTQHSHLEVLCATRLFYWI